MKSSKTTLTASEFRGLHEWFVEEETRLVRKSLVWARKHAPVFALGEIRAINGEQLSMDNSAAHPNTAPLRTQIVL